MNSFKKFLLDMVTEPGNDIICPVRILAVAGFAWALVMSGWSVFALKVAFDITAFGTSYGVMLAAMGAALAMKVNTAAIKKE